MDGVVDKGEWDDALVIRQAADPWPHDTMVQKLNVKYDPADLACTVRMKHDGVRLYVLCEIVDDILYNLDTEEWIPEKYKDRQKPCWKSPAGQEDWGYWGDCFEIGICANMKGDYKSFPVTGPVDPSKPGECWKVQGNISYGRVMTGDVLKEWVDNGFMKCAMKRLEKGKGYVLEWSITLNPCLAVGEGRYYEPGKSEPLGLQLTIVDVDTPEAGAGHPHPLIHHQGIWPYCGKGPKKARVNWARLYLDPPKNPTLFEQTRRFLPDLSEGMAGLVGPFFWGRAADLGADVKFCDQYGRADTKGEFLWLYQLKRDARKNPACPMLHERNNLVARDPRIAYEFQPWHVVLNTPQTNQVLKLMVGYVAKHHKFQHGDNTDLTHLANTPRVAVFVPIRRAAQERSCDQADYVIDLKHDQAPFGVFELDANETMASGPMYVAVAKHRVLFDLRDRFKAETVHPGVTKPLFRFTIEGGGKWTLKIKLDGRDGAGGGPGDKGWDMVFTQSSPGAKPYTVDLAPENTAWALSVFNPGGAVESSEIIVGLKPFDRSTGRPAPWPDRRPRIISCPAETLTRIGASNDMPGYDANGRLQGKKPPK
ncbi:MAG: hypothetical protein ABR915_04300 [Thermoguttaceae bacterium]